jgi:hypothetical protein
MGVSILESINMKPPWKNSYESIPLKIMSYKSSSDRAAEIKHYFPDVSNELSKVLAKVICYQSDMTVTASQFRQLLIGVKFWYSRTANIHGHRMLLERAPPKEPSPDRCRITDGTSGNHDNGTAIHAAADVRVRLA